MNTLASTAPLPHEQAPLAELQRQWRPSSEQQHAAIDACTRVLTRVSSCSANTVRNDLLNEKPIWPYTCYAPSKGELNLVSGQDLSPEELRVEYVRAVKANNPAQYVGPTLHTH